MTGIGMGSREFSRQQAGVRRHPEVLKIVMFFKYLFGIVNEKEFIRMQRVREAAFKICAKNRRDGSFRRNPLMTPLLPSVIRMEWTA
ncbi:hypothetical protein YH63_008605 [Afipia massiliensis]|uniref:Uncharacterized protein n=1 Tax=Afipia massiliensis TaxID=211460 RepID=A0A4U6BR38_9BRAD|nr:hypothetical protein [Afipia massiliensis]TKT71468.1 hypothetical protein YH63_008605 [Afipia massiliensis]